MIVGVSLRERLNAINDELFEDIQFESISEKPSKSYQDLASSKTAFRLFIDFKINSPMFAYDNDFFQLKPSQIESLLLKPTEYWHLVLFELLPIVTQQGK